MKTKKNFSETYITKFGWMVEITKDRYEADLLALIYGFSQDGESEFTGSISYITKWLQCSRRKAINVAKSLTESGMIIKRQIEINGVVFNRYSVSFEKIESMRTGSAQDALGVVHKMHGGSAQYAPNNTNNNTNNNNTVEKTKFSDDVCAIVEFLNDQTGSRYRPTTKKTKDCIKARMNEGFLLDEFKTVIKHKAKEWLGTDSEKWLRPETLFGNKFEGYLNDAIRKQNNGKKETNGAIVDENGNIKLKTTKKHASNAELEKEKAHMARLRELQRQVYGV